MTSKPDMSFSFFPLVLVCFLFESASRSSGSGASRSLTASASLKNTMFPSTSMKLIWLKSSIFSEERPKRSFLERISCSIISCIFSFREWISAVRDSSCSCWFKNICTRSDLSTLFSCSSVYLIAITDAPLISSSIIADTAYLRHQATVCHSSF